MKTKAINSSMEMSTINPPGKPYTGLEISYSPAISVLIDNNSEVNLCIKSIEITKNGQSHPLLKTKSDKYSKIEPNEAFDEKFSTEDILEDFNLMHDKKFESLLDFEIVITEVNGKSVKLSIP